MTRFTFQLLLVLSCCFVCLGQKGADAYVSASDSYNACLGFNGNSRAAADSHGAFEKFFREADGQASPEEVLKALKSDDSLRSILAKEVANTPSFLGRAKDICLSSAVESIGNGSSGKNAQDSDTLVLKGNIYAGIAERLTEDGTDPGVFLKHIEAVDSEVTAFEAFRQALKTAGPDKQKLAALRGMFDLQPTLGKLGTRYFNAGIFEKAKRDFGLMFESHDTLMKERAASFLREKANFNLAQYFRARALIETGQAEEGRKDLEKLFKSGFPEAGVYSVLYTLTFKEKGRDAALPYLRKGRELLPDDPSLLMLEINDDQASGNTGSAVENLKKAIAQQPGNASFRVTLAQAYDRMFLIEANKGDPTEAKKLFAQAAESYGKALELEPNNFSAAYGLGALYFNNAVVVSKSLKQYEGLTTPEATAKFDSILKEVFAQFSAGLPYLKKAETLDPNDTQTLTALAQIYDSTNETALAAEFRARLSKVQSGGKNEKSYFASQ